MARLQRDLNREQFWRRHLDQQHSGGLTVRAYCRANALRETAFFYWKKEIAKRNREATSSAPPSAPAFVPVAVIDAPDSRTETPIAIHLAAGHRLRVRSGCNRELLADVLALLAKPEREGRSC